MNSIDKNKFKYVVGGVVLIAFLIVVYALSWKIIPPENEQVFNIMVGLIAANVSNMINYYFGTSSSSKAKDEVIADVINKKP